MRPVIWEPILTMAPVCAVTDPVADTVWFNDGTGRFSDSGQQLGSDSTLGLALADLDGDGDLDALTANGGLFSAEPLQVWLNSGLGVFSPGASFGSLMSTAVALGDLDGDGDLDALVTGQVGWPSQVWLNSGNATFALRQSLSDAGSNAVALGDLDGDGDLDAFLGNGGGEGHTVWLNDGTGLFTQSEQVLGTDFGYAVALGDLDGDGDLDAVVPGLFSPLTVWINNGSGQFALSGQQFGSNWGLAAALGDLDGDGDLDVFASQGQPYTCRVWLNESEASGVDYGDAPDGPYPTLLSHSGASHGIIAGFCLGSRVDAEPDGLPSDAAEGDDQLGADDEDGVFLDSVFWAGRRATVTVVVTDDHRSGGYLDAWIDWNRDGDWLGPGERLFINQLVHHGINVFQFDVPADASP